MTCPPGCTCPESLLAKGNPSKSRYFTGISVPVIFVALLSMLAFLAVILAAAVVAVNQLLFFFLLPLASAAGGAFLIAAPGTTPLGSDPSVALLLRLAGAVAIAYSGGAMLVGRSACPKTMSAHLSLISVTLGSMAVAFFLDENSLLAGSEVSQKATVMLGAMAAAAAAGATMNALSPRVKRKIQSGKPGKPQSAKMCMMS